jgi:hypothetical protein
MYTQQSDFLPLATKLIGIAILVSSICVTLIEVIFKLLSIKEPIDIVITFVAALIVALIPIWIGLFLTKMFPSVRVVSDGIKYMSLSFIKRTIKWNEIEDVLLFENGYIAITFQSRGSFILNGTYFNKLYGMIIRHEYPSLFLSPGTTGRDEILTAIYSNSNVKKLKKIVSRRS